MRLPRLRRRTLAPERNWTLNTGTGRFENLTAEEAVALAAVSPTTKEERVSTEVRRGRILRSTTKRQPRTAGEIAARSGLAAADGSGRAISGDIAALVQEGALLRHGRLGHYSYTRA